MPYTSEYYTVLTDHIKHPKKYQARRLRDAVPEEKEDIFTDDLIDVFEKMLTPDP